MTNFGRAVLATAASVLGLSIAAFAWDAGPKPTKLPTAVLEFRPDDQIYGFRDHGEAVAYCTRAGRGFVRGDGEWVEDAGPFVKAVCPVLAAGLPK